MDGRDELRARVEAVRRAIDETEADLARMPFFVRPMVRAGFEKRTGLAFEGWRALLTGLDLTAGSERVRAEARPRLVGLLEHYRTAPDRVRRGMGSDLGAVAEAINRSRLRAEAVDALLAGLDRAGLSR